MKSISVGGNKDCMFLVFYVEMIFELFNRGLETFFLTAKDFLRNRELDLLER